MRPWATTVLLLGVLGGAAAGAERVIGWRGDGSGHFPDATPPTRFSEHENLTWKADVGQGCGAAIVVGDRLFLQAAPNALVCLDKASGKELWRRDRHLGRLAPDLPACRLDAVMDQVGRMHDLKQAFHRLEKESPERVKLEAELTARLAALPEELPPLPGAGINTAWRKDGGGYTSLGVHLICVTPCTDGRRVVALFPTGIAVAYDLAGRWLWSADVSPLTALSRPADWPRDRKWRPMPGILSACPVLAPEGIVVVRFGALTAGLEAASGRMVWRTVASSGSQASPVVGVVGGESFVATDGGDVLRARDGLVVHRGQIPSSECSVSPVFADGVFHWVTHAVKVEGGDMPRATVLWEWSTEGLRAASEGWHAGGFPYPGPHLTGHVDFTSPVVVGEQLLYYAWNRMNVIEAATGKVLAQHRLAKSPVRPLARGVTKNWAYGGMVRAGDWLVLVHDNGLVKTFPLNATFSPMQACALPDDVYAQPTCDGPALYIRSLNALWRFDHPATASGTGK